MNDTQKIQHPQSVREFTGDYNGHTLTIRYYCEDGVHLLRLDDEFARSIGFDTMADIVRLSPIFGDYEWIDTELIAGAEALISAPAN